MDDTLDMVDKLFNLGLAVLLAACLWSLVHPEHFIWLRRIFPKRQPVEHTLPRWLRVTGWILFFAYMAGAVVFGLVHLLHQKL